MTGLPLSCAERRFAVLRMYSDPWARSLSQLLRLVLSVAECVGGVSLLLSGVGWDAWQVLGGSFILMMTQSRTPCQRSRSWSPRKGYLRDRRLGNQVSLVATVG